MSGTIKRSNFLVTVPLAVGAAAYVYFIFLPGQKVTAELREQVQSKQQTSGQGTSLDQAIATTNKELMKTTSHTAGWWECSPDHGELSLLYAKIRELASAAGTVITRFDPEQVQTYPFLQETPLSVGCSGTFAQVFRFLSDLESLPQTIWVKDLVIDKTDSSGGSVDCELRLVIFADNPGNSDYVNHSK